MSETVYRALGMLGQPFTLVACVLLVCVSALLKSNRHNRTVRPLVASLALALYAVSNPLVAVWATRTLERRHPPASLSDVRRTEALVVLAGGLRKGRDNQGELSLDTVSRCLHAAELYRTAGPRLMLVSGGQIATGPPGVSVAAVMKRFLLELGVAEADLLEETRSTTTFENAAQSAPLLSARGISHVTLVTSATHLPRAVAVFARQGLQVVPAGVGYSDVFRPIGLTDLLPNAAAADSINRAAHEWLGMAWYRLHGRL